MVVVSAMGSHITSPVKVCRSLKMLWNVHFGSLRYCLMPSCDPPQTYQIVFLLSRLKGKVGTLLEKILLLSSGD